MSGRTERDYDYAMSLLPELLSDQDQHLVVAITKRVTQLEMQAELEAYRSRGHKPWSRSRDTDG